MMRIACGSALAFTALYSSSLAQSASLPFGADAGFVENLGQHPRDVRFAARVPGATVFLTDSDVRFALVSGEAVFMRFDTAGSTLLRPNGNPRLQLKALDELPGRHHSFRGNDPAHWIRDAKAFRRVVSRGVAPGIDIAFSIVGGRFEYDVLAQPGSELDRLNVKFDGVRASRQSLDGTITLFTECGHFSHGNPLTFSSNGVGGRRSESLRASVLPGHSVQYSSITHASNAHVVIDPVLDFSTYLGWSDTGDIPYDAAVAEDGTTYLCGMVFSPEFPISTGAYTTGPVLSYDAMIVRLDANGQALLFSTAIGGSAHEIANSMQLGNDGRVTISGSTGSTNFPVTPTAYSKSKLGGYDAFVLQLSADGSSLLGATYFGGPGSSLEVQQNGLAVDVLGRSYIVGGQIGPLGIPTTPDAVFPTKPGGSDCSLAILSSDLSTLEHCTYIGGPNGDSLAAIAVDAAGGIFVAGKTFGQFPVTAGAFDVTHFGFNIPDFFVMKLKPMGQGIRYATYIGGNDAEQFLRVAVTSDGKATLMGQTYSVNYPATPSSFDPTFDGINNVCVTQLNSQGSALTYSGFVHSGGDALGTAIKVDIGGSAYVAGRATPNFVATPNAFDPTPNGIGDAVLCRIDPSGSSILYATFFGGTANTESAWAVGVNANRKVALAGITDSTDLPVTPGAYQPNLDPGAFGVVGDGFVAAFDLCNGAFSSYGSGCAGSSSTPSLSGTGCPSAGATISITLSNALPFAPAALFLGLGQGSLPLNGSCTLQIAPLFPTFVLPFSIPASGSMTISSTLPVPLLKASLFFQALVADPTAPAGLAASAPMKMLIGD